MVWEIGSLRPQQANSGPATGREQLLAAHEYSLNVMTTAYAIFQALGLGCGLHAWLLLSNLAVLSFYLSNSWGTWSDFNYSC